MQDSTGLIGFKVRIHGNEASGKDINGTIVGSYTGPSMDEAGRDVPPSITWFVIEGEDGLIWQFTPEHFDFVAPSILEADPIPFTDSPLPKERDLLHRMFTSLCDDGGDPAFTAQQQYYANEFYGKFIQEWEAMQ